MTVTLWNSENLQTVYGLVQKMDEATQKRILPRLNAESALKKEMLNRLNTLVTPPSADPSQKYAEICKHALLMPTKMFHDLNMLLQINFANTG